MRQEYTATFKQQGIFGTLNCVRFFSYDDVKDHRKEIAEELQKTYGDDPKFSICMIHADVNNSIDYALIDRMKAIRLVCELGRRVRAEAEIKNRQPLRKAYVAISDKEVSDYMLYIDCGKEEYTNIIRDELNVFEVEFITGDEAKFFDYSLKPNFRTLGKKGFGKQAQILKADLSKMDANTATALYNKLKAGETVDVVGVPLSAEDIETSIIPKPGFAAASDKVGAIILDTKVDDFLLDRGFVAEFRAEMQKLRKDTNLQLTDKIAIEVFCEFERSKTSIENMATSLKKHLLATNISFPTKDKLDNTAHTLSVNGEKVYVRMWKECAI